MTVKRYANRERLLKENPVLSFNIFTKDGEYIIKSKQIDGYERYLIQEDGNKLNNSIDNLEWCNNKDNTQHGYDNGLYRFKSRCHAINVYKKTNHEFYKQFKSIRSMCDELKINRKTVTMILKGEKLTNNYKYDFEYVEESQETIESIVNEKNISEEASRVQFVMKFTIGSAERLMDGNRTLTEDIVQ